MDEVRGKKRNLVGKNYGGRIYEQNICINLCIIKG